MNLDAVLRIAAKVTGTGAVENLNKALGAAEKTADSAKGAFKSVITSSSWQAAAAAAAGIGTALTLSTRAAIDFETAIADVRKVMADLSATGVQEIREEILQLSREMPITAQGFAKIYAAAASSGIARGEIQGFARDVAQMSIAFDMTAEDAGRSMATLRAALGLTQPEVRSLADALNFLSNNMGATAAQLVDFTQRTAAMGRLAGLAGEQTAAFGAAMIGMGVETEVAATSFNNMIRALSRGASMTARQESALERLGLATRTVASGQAELTAAVQRGSDRRLEIIQDESDRQQDELRKRHRRQMQLLEDQWEDETDTYTDALRDQTDAQIKALQRQAEERIRIIERQEGLTEEQVRRQTDAIRDGLEEQIDLIRDATDRELKLRQRADRDRRQQVRDSAEAQLEVETRAIQRAASERERAEKEGTKRAIEAAKAAAEAGGSEAGRRLAKRLQDDALGTIRDVFARIRGLAADERISVISDLFGDDARGLAPLVNNMGELEKALGLVGDQTKYAGSMAREYEQRAATTANKIQMLKNSVVPLQVAIGERLIPVIDELLPKITPLISRMVDWLNANPQLATGIALVAAALSGLVAALPFIASIATIAAAIPVLVAGMKAVAIGIGATIAAFSALVASIASPIAALQAFSAAVGAVVAAIATAPVLVTIAIAAIVGAVVAAVIVWRNEIGGFFVWLAESAAAGWNALIAPLRPVIDSFVVLWNSVMERVGAIYAALAQLFYQTYIEPVQKAMLAFTELLVSFWSAAFNAVADIIMGWVDSVQKAFTFLAKLYHSIVIKPIMEAAEGVWKFLVSGWNALNGTVSGIFRAIAKAYDNIVVKPLTTAWTRITDTAKAALRGLLGWAARAINGVIDMVNRVIAGINAVRRAAGLSTYATIGRVEVPKFAKGGFVTGETLAMLGDNRSGREYAVPEEKAVGFANNIIAGRRGAAAIPTGTSSGGSSGGSVSINITTGPVRQDASGQRWMTIEDGERMARDVAAQVLRTQRTPGGRYASGVR